MSEEKLCFYGLFLPCESCYYKPCEEPEHVEDIELCDYTGEQCIGNKRFCEECEIMMGDLDDE